MVLIEKARYNYFVANDLFVRNKLGADSGFDKIHETQGACPGAVGLVKSRKTIIANDETFALAA